MTEIASRKPPRRRRGPKPRPNMGGSIAIQRMPRSIKRRLIRAANERGSNINDVAVAALAAKFNIPFIRTGNRSPIKPGVDGQVLLSMPKSLELKIKNAAINNGITYQDVVIAILAEAENL